MKRHVLFSTGPFQKHPTDSLKWQGDSHNGGLRTTTKIELSLVHTALAPRSVWLAPRPPVTFSQAAAMFTGQGICSFQRLKPFSKCFWMLPWLWEEKPANFQPNIYNNKIYFRIRVQNPKYRKWHNYVLCDREKENINIKFEPGSAVLWLLCNGHQKHLMNHVQMDSCLYWNWIFGIASPRADTHPRLIIGLVKHHHPSSRDHWEQHLVEFILVTCDEHFWPKLREAWCCPTGFCSLSIAAEGLPWWETGLISQSQPCQFS